MDGQGILNSEVPLLLLIMNLAIIPKNYNAATFKDDS